jgi:hypothetical protein
MLLAIDTAGPWVSVCAGGGGAGFQSARRSTRLDHNETLALLLGEVLEKSGGPVIQAVAVDVGPGSFTGTRVGVAFAGGLAEGWGVPIVPVSAFVVAAELAPADAEEVIVAFPVVRDGWCRAHLVRDGAGWREISAAEVRLEAVRGGAAGVPLVVPWGDLPGAIVPPDDWNPAWQVLRCAERELTAPDVTGRSVQVRYMGPSQAERNFHARRDRSPRSSAN